MDQSLDAAPVLNRREDPLALLHSRRSVVAANLTEPGPDADALDAILRAGARVPDHGKLAPWRFVLFRGDARARFGDVLADAFTASHPDAKERKIEFERARFTRAPVVVAVISRYVPGKIPEWEQILSSGAVCQNMLIAATALGYAAQWITEWYAYDAAVGRALGLGEGERVAGFVYLGSADAPPKERARPELSELISEWAPGGG